MTLLLIISFGVHFARRSFLLILWKS